MFPHIYILSYDISKNEFLYPIKNFTNFLTLIENQKEVFQTVLSRYMSLEVFDTIKNKYKNLETDEFR